MISRELAKEIDSVIEKYRGSGPDLGNAIGAYVLGQYFGWKPLLLMYSRGSIRKYEQILGVTFKDKLLEEGPRAKRHKAYVLLQKAENYWNAIRSGKAVPDSKLIR